MGRNKYTPEQMLEVFRIKFAERYPGVKAIIKIDPDNRIHHNEDGSTTVIIGIPEPKEEPIKFFDHNKKPSTMHHELDRDIHSLLMGCDQLRETSARPVKNALEAHEAVACINRALDNVAYTSRKVAETAERLRK